MGRITAFFQRVFKFTYYKSALERLEGQATFKFRAFWSVRGGKGLKEEHFAFGIFPPKTKEILSWQQREQNCWIPPDVIW
jgi:hypothetical protein